MGKKGKQTKSYSDRTDMEKLDSNWRKVAGFMKRGEWSAAITRAATAAEIAANIAVRAELQQNRHIEADFVDHLLIWANGLAGKLEKLLRPLHTDKDKKKAFKEIKSKAEVINKKRNEVAHSGHFMNKKEAEEVVELATQFIDLLLAQYHAGFKLTHRKKS